MVRVANVTGLPTGATILVGRPVILSRPRSIRVAGPLGGAGVAAAADVLAAALAGTCTATGLGGGVKVSEALCARATVAEARTRLAASAFTATEPGPAGQALPAW